MAFLVIGSFLVVVEGRKEEGKQGSKEARKKARKQGSKDARMQGRKEGRKAGRQAGRKEENPYLPPKNDGKSNGIK